MFCSNCGKQIPDNTKFCSFCGTQQQRLENADPAPKTTEDQPKVAEAPTPQPQKAPKKKANIFIILAVVLCAFIIGKFVIAPSMVSDSEKNESSGDQSSRSQATDNNSSTVNVTNPEYEAIFEDTYIVHFQTFFNMETESFAMKKDGGIIACSDYGYKDDTVKQWVETLYVPVSGRTESQKAELETTMKAQFASLDALNCCTATYKMSTNYFTMTFTYSGMDQASSYTEMYNAGFLETNTPVSMSLTETNLLKQGFVKK